MKVKKKKHFITISNLVRATLGKNLDYSAKALAKRVAKEFPKSAWGPTHHSWYRSRIKAGKLKGVQ